MHKKEQHKRFNFVRILFGIVFAIFFFASLSIALLYFNTERIINQNLSDFVYQKSDSTYRFKFESLHLDLMEHKMVITAITLVPDSLIEPDSTKSYYELFTPSISIENIKYLPMLKEQRFVAGKFKIEAPNFRLTTGDRVRLAQFENTPMKKGDILKIPVFSEIFFDTLLVVDASLNIDSTFIEKYELPKVNIEVLNFKLGGQKLTETPFPFDVSDLSLKIENISDELADSVHLLTIKQINLSLLHSTIKAQQITLKPKEGITNSRENLYTFDIPEIVFKSSVVDKIYMLDTISADTMVMKNPSINIRFGKKVKKGTPPNEINLHKLIEKSLKWVKIKQFSIQNGDVKFYANLAEKESQHFEKLDINFYDFMIDANSYRNPTRILSATNLSASLAGFTLVHNDKVHVLTIENLIADTRTKSLITGNVKFQPEKGATQAIATKIYVVSDGLIFNGFNFHELYHHQIIPMKEMEVKSPQIHIDFDQKSMTQKTKQNKSILLEKTRDYLTGIYVETAKITKGSVEFNYHNHNDNQGFFKTKFNFELKKLSIDSVTFYQTDKIFFAHDFNILFSDISLQLADNKHQLLTKTVNLSSIDQSAEINEMQIIPRKDELNPDSTIMDNNSETYNINFPRIVLNGANLHKAFFEKQLFISNLTVFNPTLNIDKKGEWKNPETPSKPYRSAMYSLIDNYLFNMQIETLNMENGVLNLSQQKGNEPKFEFSNLFSIKMSNFELNESSATQKNKLFFSDNIDLILKNQKLGLPDGVHKLEADEIGIISSKNEIYVKKAILAPNLLSKTFKNLPVSIFASIPEMKITGANIFELMNEGKFNVNTITFNHPEIKLLFQKTDGKEKRKIEKDKNPLLLFEGVKSVSTNWIRINGGSMEMANYTDSKSKTFSTTTIGFEMENFRIAIKNDELHNSYSNFFIKLEDFKYDLPDQTHSIKAEKISYQLNTKTLDVSNFTLLPKQGIVLTNDKQYYSVGLPFIKLTDIDLEDYLRNKNLIANSLQLKNPVIKIDDKRTEKKKPVSPYHIDLYSGIKSILKNLEIKEVSLENTEFAITGEKPINLKKFDLTTYNLKINPSTQPNNKLFFSDRFNFRINEINGKTKGGYYNYHANSLVINENGNFSISGITLKPVYSQKEFVKLKKTQADYYNIDNVDMTGEGLNLKNYIENNQLEIKSLYAQFHDLKIHRDKTVPIQTNSKTKLPQQLLRDMKQKIFIEKLLFSFNDFIYTELIVDVPEPTNFNIAKMNIESSNITNIEERIALNPTLQAKIDGKLMGIGEMHVEMNFNIPAIDNKFTFDAQCGAMPLNIFNPITETGLMLSVKEGYNKKLDVYFEANEDSAVGTMKFEYNDLKVSVLSNHHGEVRKDKLVSFFANTFVKSDNPKQGKVVVPVDIKYQREEKRSVIAYCWKSVLTGLKNTFGLKDKD